MKTAAIFFLFLFTAIMPVSKTIHKPDDIVGLWMHSDKKLKVQVYKVNGEYRGKVVWFMDTHYKAKMDVCKDEMNPDPALRDRLVLGLEVLTKLRFDVKDNNWQDGLIYDSNTGKTYSSVVNMYTESTLTVTGYWMFSWLGKSMNFFRVKE